MKPHFIRKYGVWICTKEFNHIEYKFCGKTPTLAYYEYCRFLAYSLGE